MLCLIKFIQGPMQIYYCIPREKQLSAKHSYPHLFECERCREKCSTKSLEYEEAFASFLPIPLVSSKLMMGYSNKRLDNVSVMFWVVMASISHSQDVGFVANTLTVFQAQWRPTINLHILTISLPNFCIILLILKSVQCNNA